MTMIELSHTPGRHRQASARDEIAYLYWLMEKVVAAAFAVPVHELRAPSRGTADVAFARQSTMYLAHVALGLSFSTVGRMVHRHRTTAAYACQMVEMRRDDPTIDRLLETLERICVELTHDIFTQQVRQ